MQSLKHGYHALADIIAWVASGKNEDFCLYGKGELTPDSRFYVSDYPGVQDDRDVYPPDVPAGAELIYYGEAMEDVISLALKQRSDLGAHELTQAMIYYYDNDDFMDFV